MAPAGPHDAAVAARARAWLHAGQAAVCDTFVRWAHGTVARASRYPDFFDLNVVRVEDDPRMSVEALAAFADEALAGLAHRRLDFDDAGVAQPLRAGFAARGWRSMRVLWMRHEAPPDEPPPDGPPGTVQEVAYDDVEHLRAAWFAEDFPGHDPGDYFRHARDVALRRGVRVLAVRAAGAPVAFAQLRSDGTAAEIDEVYVDPRVRGRGLGTRMTAAAIEAAGAVDDLWIVADDEDRPKELYARLGFRPAWTAVEFSRHPPAACRGAARTR